MKLCIHMQSNITIAMALVTNSNQPQAVTTCITLSLYCITKYGSTLYIGMDEVLAHYVCTFENSDLHFHLIVHLWHHRMIAKVNMYVYLKFG